MYSRQIALPMLLHQKNAWQTLTDEHQIGGREDP